MSPYVCDCTNVVYMFCIYCIYYYANKFEARSLFSTSHLKPHFPVIDVLRTETTRPKRNRHSSTDTERCNVMISPVFEPRPKNRKVLTSPVNTLNNDFSNWT